MRSKCLINITKHSDRVSLSLNEASDSKSFCIVSLSGISLTVL